MSSLGGKHEHKEAFLSTVVAESDDQHHLIAASAFIKNVMATNGKSE